MSQLLARHLVMSSSLQPHGLYSSWILQARILEWVAFPFSRESSQPRSLALWAQVSCIVRHQGSHKEAHSGHLSLRRWGSRQAGKLEAANRRWGPSVTWDGGRCAQTSPWARRASLSHRVFIRSCSGRSQVCPQSGPTGRLQHS